MKYSKNIIFNVQYDGKLRVFSQEIKIENHEIYVRIDNLAENDVTKANVEISKIWNWTVENIDEIKNFIANNAELPEKVTAETFKKAIKNIECIQVNYNDNFSVVFSYEDLYWAHGLHIVISCSFKMLYTDFL